MLLPNNIDLGKSEQYVLTIRIMPNAFAFSIHEPRIGGEYTFRETSFTKETDSLENIQRIVFDYNFLTYVYLKTNVVFVSKEYDVSPQYLFEKNKKEQLYSFTHQDEPQQILVCPNIVQKNVSMFNVDPEIYKFLIRSLYNPIFHHHSNLLLGYIDGKNRTAEKTNKMYLSFHNEFVDVFCYNSNSELLHVLTYQNEEEQNIIYFILNMWDKAGFDQNKDYLYILENFVGSTTSIETTLRDYIRHIEIIGAPTEIEFMGEDCKKAPLDLLILATI